MKRLLCLILAFALSLGLPAIGNPEHSETDSSHDADMVIVNSTTDDSAAINLSLEECTLPEDYSAVAYSLDGGNKWKKGALPISGKNFGKLFNKELTLWLSDKSGGNEEDAKLIKFPKINARPSGKLKPYYIYTESNGFDEAARYHESWKWVLAKKEGNEAVIITGDYEIAECNKQKIPTGQWKSVDGNGIELVTWEGKKNGGLPLYLVRMPPSEKGGNYTPALTPFLVKPDSVGKPKFYKPNYKTETIKMKGGEKVFAGSTVINNVPKGDFDIKGYLDVTTNLTIIPTPYNSWKAPPDAFVINNPKRGNVSQFAKQIIVDKGKLAISSDNKNYPFSKYYEVYDEQKQKWGSLPNLKDNGKYDFTVRLKAEGNLSMSDGQPPSVSWEDNGESGYAASAPGKLRITVGSIDVIDKKDGSVKDKVPGIVSAEITVT